MKKHRALIILVSLTFLIPFGLYSQNVPSTPSVPPTVSAVPPTDTPKPIKTIELKGEGYNGIPWGTSLDDFLHVKGLVGQSIPDADQYFGQDDETEGFREELAAITKVPFVLKMGAETEIQYDLVPHGFVPIKIESEDLKYIFYKGKLAMAFSVLHAKNYAIYHDKLVQKYTFLGNIKKNVKFLTGYNDSITIECYKKAGTRVYLMQTNMSGLVKLGLVYFSDSQFKLVSSDISKNVNNQNKEIQNKENQDSQEDLNKIK